MKNIFKTHFGRAVALRTLMFTCLVSESHAQTLPDNGKQLFDAAASGDVVALQILIPNIDPNFADESGKTALMTAAENGQLEAARFLLLHGADARQRDKGERSAVGYLSAANSGFAPMNLLLRCFGYLREIEPVGKAKVPHLVLVNDNFVDYAHPDLAASYVLNDAENDGEMGKDDDGNGFVDDVFGWNAVDNRPLRRPFASFLDEPDEQQFVKRVIEELGEWQRNAAMMGDSEGDWIENPMATRYENPVVRDLGRSALSIARADINDYVFAEMVFDASHGTHVAGIVSHASEGKALLHAMTLENRSTPEKIVWENWKWAEQKAKESNTYTQFILNLRQEVQERSLAWGERASSYIQASGAGVMNMSWGRPRGYYENLAERIQNVYGQSGVNPASMLSFSCPIGVDLCADLALELMVADAAGYVLMMAENPDVLFVMSSGNEGLDCDQQIPSPGYLSRFLPNAITVAWLDEEGNPSEHSNYGRRSVQLGALGEEVESAVLGGGRAKMSGTSMAAPQVAGVAALLRADFPDLSASDVRRILEVSSRSLASLADITTTGGSLDTEKAREVAASWKPGIEPLRDSELARMGITGQDGPRLSAHGRAGDWYLTNEEEYSQDSWRVSSIGGFPNSWMVSFARGTGHREQVMTLPDAEPWDGVQSFLNEGYEVTSLAGDSGAWTVILSRDEVEARAQLIGSLDQTWIANTMEQGFAITSVAGWKSTWQVVMTENKGWGKQRFTLPGNFDDKRKAWIKKRLAEGYRITSLAGDELGEGEPGSWLVVLTQNSGLGDQIFHGIGPWPSEWIEKNSATGFRVTSFAGFRDNWVVVMTQDSALGEQKFVGPGEFDRWKLLMGLNGEFDEE